LMRAQKVSKKAAIDADSDTYALIDTLKEQVEALGAMTEKEAQSKMLGQALFGLTTLARRLDLDAEECLSAHTDRLIKSVK